MNRFLCVLVVGPDAVTAIIRRTCISLLLLVSFALGARAEEQYQGADLRLDDIVIVEDMTDWPARWAFPCVQFMGATFCNSRVRIANRDCEATLAFNNDVITCTPGIATRLVRIGRILRRTRSADDTQDGQFFYQIQYEPGVRLEQSRTRNGSSEYEIVVE